MQRSTRWSTTRRPLELWRTLAPRAQGRGVPGGHFFAEEHPADTATALAEFFAP